MFRGKDGPIRPGAFESVLGKGVEIEGTVKSRGSIRIDSKIQGKIHCSADVMIGESALVNGDIQGGNVTIAGAVAGDINASGRLEILTSGRVEGDTCSGSLVISEGAKFSGTSKMLESPQPAKKSLGE